MRVLSAGDAHRRRRSRRHSVLLLIAMAVLLAYCGWLAVGWEGILWSVIGGAAMLLMVRRMPPGVFLQALNARPLARWEAPALYKILDELCRRTGLGQVPLLCRVSGRSPVALTIGRGAETTIVLSHSLLQTLPGRELRGVLAHEIVHVRNGDLALMQLAMVIGLLTRALSQVALALAFFSLFLRLVSARAVPILPLLVLAVAPLGVNLLQLALSRARETEADLEAAELTGDPYGLASALVKMRNQQKVLLRLPSLFRDHPATDERIRRLLAALPPKHWNPEEDHFREFRRRRMTGPWG
jgi:heat shock protein HtpX